MKRLLILMILASVTLLAGCGLAGEEEKLQVTNPLRESTAEGIMQEFGVCFPVPEGAEDVQYFIINMQESAIAEMRFLYGGVNGTCRVQSAGIPDGAVPDISGMFFDWENEAETAVGYNDATLTWNEGAEGVIRWYDSAAGLVYCVSVSGGASEDSLRELAAQLYGPAQGDADTAAADAVQELTALLASISQDYQFGVLGSSLRAAIYAGTLMDWFSANPADKSAVDAAVIDFLSTLDTEELESFPWKLEHVEEAMEELLSENGDALLDACGYDPAYAPWDGEQMRRCFDMVWEIVGRTE